MIGMRISSSSPEGNESPEDCIRIKPIALNQKASSTLSLFIKEILFMCVPSAAAPLKSHSLLCGEKNGNASFEVVEKRSASFELEVASFEVVELKIIFFTNLLPD